MPCMGTSVKESDKRKEAAERRRKQMQLMQEAKKKKETKNEEEEEEERERQKEVEQRKHQDKNNTQTEKTLKDSKYENKKESTNTSKVSTKRSASPPSSSLSPQRLPILVHEESYYSNIAESRSSKERSEAKRKGEECNSHVSSTVNNSTATDASAVIDGKDNTEKNNLYSSEKSNSKDGETNVISNLENPVERERLMQQMLQQALQLNEMLEHELQDARQKLKDTPATTNSSSLSSSYSSALIHKPHKSNVQRKDDNNKHKLSSQGQAQTPRVTICETPSQRSLSAKRENSKQLDKMDNNNINNSSKNKNTNATTTTTKGENDPEALLQRAIEEKWSNDEILCKAREAVKHCPPKEAMNTLQILRDVYLLRRNHMTHALERDARKRELSNINKNNKDVHLHSPRALSYPAGPQNGTLHYNSNKDKKNNNKESDKIKNNYSNNNNNKTNVVNDKYYYYQSRPVEPRRGRIANDYENKKQTNGNEKSYYRSQSAYLPRNSYRNDDAQYLTNKRYEPRYENVHYPRNFHNPYHHRHHHHHSSSSSRPHYRDNNNNNNQSSSNNYQKYGEDKYTSPSSPYRRYHFEPRQRRSYDDLLQLHSPSYRNNTMSTKYNNDNAYRPNAHAPAAAEKFHRTTHLPHGYELDKITNIDDNKIVNAPYVVRGRLSASQTDIIAALENGYVSQAKRVLA